MTVESSVSPGPSGPDQSGPGNASRLRAAFDGDGADIVHAQDCISANARGDPLVLAVGGIEPRKGTIDLIDAVAALADRRPGVRLAIVGGETLFDYRDYRAEFDRRRGELGIDVDVLGPVAHDALPALVAAADVFAFPSTKEGFGMAAMEALAAGTPVVARDLPVLREIFGDTVRYGRDQASLASALAAAADDDDPARLAAGRDLARRHTWEAAAKAHDAFYERVLAAS